MLRFLSLFILQCLVAAFLLAQPPALAKRIEAVENSLIPYVPVKNFKGWNILDRMKYFKVPGVSIAVIRDFKIDWAKSYGLADTTKKIPVTNETLFSAGSVSKLVMAAAAMKLVEDKKLSLDSPINNYLTSWKLAENDFTRRKPITLRMLLSHTAGTSQSAYWGFTPNTKKLPTIVEVLSGATVAETNPVVVNSEPGKEFRYSGGGSIVAQLAIMDVTRSAFPEFIQRTIFDKVGMKRSSFLQPLPKHLNAKAAWGYSAAPWYKGMPYVYPQLAAAGLYTTATDLAKFLIALQKSYAGSSHLLSPQTMRQMFTPQAVISEGGYKEEIGVGPFLLEQSGNTSTKGKYFEHQGANAGFIAYAIASVEGGNGVVILLNTGDDFNGFGKELRRAVAKVYNWPGFLPSQLEPVATASEDLNQYVGRYRKGPDEVVTIKREQSYLVETINDGFAIYCFPVGKDSIVFTDFNVRGFFTRDSMKKVAGLKTEYQQVAMPKMAANEFSAGEYLKMRRYIEAKEGYRAMKMNEYAITGFAYELLAKKPLDTVGVKTILELAAEQFPQSSLVFARWGDYYLLIKNSAEALVNYQKSLNLDPGNKDLKDKISTLLK